MQGFFSGFHSRGGKYIAANFKQRQIQIQGGGGNTTTPILHTMYMYYREANFQRRGGAKAPEINPETYRWSTGYFLEILHNPHVYYMCVCVCVCVCDRSCDPYMYMYTYTCRCGSNCSLRIGEFCGCDRLTETCPRGGMNNLQCNGESATCTCTCTCMIICDRIWENPP